MIGTPNRNIIEGLQDEMNRVREIIKIYEEVPNNAGVFAATQMKLELEKAEKVIAEGDTVAMVRMYQKLTQWEL